MGEPDRAPDLRDVLNRVNAERSPLWNVPIPEAVEQLERTFPMRLAGFAGAFEARSDARYCGVRCRVAAHRARAAEGGGGVVRPGGSALCVWDDRPPGPIVPFREAEAAALDLVLKCWVV